MSANYFLDTNILIYAFDRCDEIKREKATLLIRNALNSGLGVISWQVCQEFLHTALHKPATAIPPEILGNYLEHVLNPLCIVHSSPSIYVRGVAIQRETGYRFYDSLIIASALESGVSTLYTEDMQHGRSIGHLKILNPFI